MNLSKDDLNNSTSYQLSYPRLELLGNRTRNALSCRATLSILAEAKFARSIFVRY